MSRFSIAQIVVISLIFFTISSTAEPRLSRNQVVESIISDFSNKSLREESCWGKSCRTRTLETRKRRREGIKILGYELLDWEFTQSAGEIDGQAPDFCKIKGSEGLFDAKVDQEFTQSFFIKNAGNKAGREVMVGFEFDTEYLRFDEWTIWDDHYDPKDDCGETWCLNDASDPSETEGNPPRINPEGDSHVFNFNSISPGETKWFELNLTVLKDSFAEGKTPEIRIWIISYRISTGEKTSTPNVVEYPEYDDGDLRIKSQYTFLGEERCNGLDDDCNDVIDEHVGAGDECIVEEESCERHGFIICSVQGTPICDVPPISTYEICDNTIDDDCNGFTDFDDPKCEEVEPDAGPDGGMDADSHGTLGDGDVPDESHGMGLGGGCSSVGRSQVLSSFFSLLGFLFGSFIQ